MRKENGETRNEQGGSSQENGEKRNGGKGETHGGKRENQFPI